LSSVGKTVDTRACWRAEDVVSIYKLLDEGCSVVEDERVGKTVDRRGCWMAEDVVSIYKLLDEGCSVVEDERVGIAK